MADFNVQSRRLDECTSYAPFSIGWTAVHMTIGYALVLIGGAALVLRLPRFQQYKKYHAMLGSIWTMGCYFMPVLACFINGPGLSSYNSTNTSVMFYIISMYSALVAGWMSMKLWRAWNGKPAIFGQAPLASKEVQMNTKSDEEQSQESTNDSASSSLPATKYNYLMYIHGCCMFYSWVMLCGAGIAFTTNFFKKGVDYTVHNQ